MAAHEKGEVAEALKELMKQDGAIGYVLINYHGIPVLSELPDASHRTAVQYSALIADLVMKTKSTLK